MSLIHRAVVGAALGTALLGTLAGGAMAAPAIPGPVCYFGECGAGTATAPSTASGERAGQRASTTWKRCRVDGRRWPVSSAFPPAPAFRSER